MKLRSKKQTLVSQKSETVVEPKPPSPLTIGYQTGAQVVGKTKCRVSASNNK